MSLPSWCVLPVGMYSPWEMVTPLIIQGAQSLYSKDISTPTMANWEPHQHDDYVGVDATSWMSKLSLEPLGFSYNM